MVSADAIRTTVGIIGNIISLILFLSPVPTFIKIWKKGSVEQFSAVPYVATSFNCGMWVLYGLPRFHKDALLVLTINATGFGIELIYLTLFLLYSDKKQRLKVAVIMVAELAVIVVIGLLVSTFVRNIDHRTTIIGSICMLGNILMYASPLSIMKMVIRTKSVEYMPFFLSLFSFLNGACWSTYALIRIDPYIVAPNGLGLLFSTAQLILYATYYKSTQRQIAERQIKGGEVGMAHTQNGHV